VRQLRRARCDGPLKVVHNHTRWVRSLQPECAARDGSCQTFAQLFGEKGLARPLSSVDRAWLAAADGLHCMKGGAPLASDDAECGWCRSVPSLVDVARLANVLDPEGAIAMQTVHRRPTADSVLACLACGPHWRAGRRWAARSVLQRWPPPGSPRPSSRSACRARRCARMQNIRRRIWYSVGWPRSRPTSNGAASGPLHAQAEPVSGSGLATEGSSLRRHKFRAGGT